jgi:hypothetical protein
VRKSTFIAVPLVLWTSGVLLAQINTNNPLITIFESGYGTLQFPGGPAFSLPGVLAPDPGPGGLASALTFNLLGPPSLVAGDVFIQEVVGTVAVTSDVIRFNPAGTGSPGYPASMVFYSDLDDPILQLADTGFPSAAYANTLSSLEVTLAPGTNGLIYTPTANQPGFIAGFNVTYDIVSDSVPEPGTASFCLIAGGLLLTGGGWLKTRAKK